MAEVVAIAAESNCNNPGGVTHVYGTNFSNITGVTVAAGVITGFTMASVGLWAKLVPDDEDDVAFINQDTQRDVVSYRIELLTFTKYDAAIESIRTCRES